MGASFETISAAAQPAEAAPQAAAATRAAASPQAAAAAPRFATVRHRLMTVLLCVMAALLLAGLVPSQAMALDVVKCTARANAESGNDVLGATQTRITFEGRAAEDEEVSGVAFTLPTGTEYSTDDLRVTMLSGADLMQRTNVAFTEETAGENLQIHFDQALPAGAYFRVEIYRVKFPAEGGQMELAGTYTLADGDARPMPTIPSIRVVSVTPAEQLSQFLEDQAWVQAWNSNKFLHLFLDPTIMVTSFPAVFKGFLMALAIVAVAFPLAIPLGLLLALMRMSKLRVLRGIATTYVNVVRGTPLFLQIYIAFFGLPLAGVMIPAFPLGVVVLSLNSSAYLCEIFRAGIQSIPKGQFEASRSLGMNAAQTMLYVIIPQTVRRVIPTMTSEFILLYKDTSLLAAVGVMEVVMYAKTIVASTGSITPYIVAACFYLVITLPLAKVVGRLEAYLAGSESGNGGKGKGKGRKARKQRKGAEAAAAKATERASVDAVLEGPGTGPQGAAMAPAMAPAGKTDAAPSGQTSAAEPGLSGMPPIGQTQRGALS